MFILYRLFDTWNSRSQFQIQSEPKPSKNEFEKKNNTTKLQQQLKITLSCTVCNTFSTQRQCNREVAAYCTLDKEQEKIPIYRSKKNHITSCFSQFTQFNIISAHLVTRVKWHFCICISVSLRFLHLFLSFLFIIDCKIPIASASTKKMLQPQNDGKNSHKIMKKNHKMVKKNRKLTTNTMRNKYWICNEMKRSLFFVIFKYELKNSLKLNGILIQ